MKKNIEYGGFIFIYCDKEKPTMSRYCYVNANVNAIYGI